MDFDRFLDQLSTTELSSLRSKVDLRLGPQPKATDPDDPALESVFRALSTTLTTLGHQKVPFRVFQRKRDFGLFQTKAVHVSKYVKKAFQPKTVVEFDFCCRLCFKLLGSWLLGIGVPLSYRTLVSNSDRIASLVDQAFPGYHQAGFLNRVIQVSTHGRGRAGSVLA